MKTKTKPTIKTLVIPANVQSAIVPKPTRAELIDAMTAIEIERIEAEQQATTEKREALKIEIENELLALPLDNIPSVPNLGGCYGANSRLSGVSIRFEFLNLPKPLAAKLCKFHALEQWHAEPKRLEIRKQILAKMNGMTEPHNRVDALLENVETKAALTKLLAAISKPAIALTLLALSSCSHLDSNGNSTSPIDRALISAEHVVNGQEK